MIVSHKSRLCMIKSHKLFLIIYGEAFMIYIEEIRAKLIESIKTSGKTQTQLAKELQVSQSCIAHYRKGDILPSLDTFANICVVLDLDPAEILCINNY